MTTPPGGLTTEGPHYAYIMGGWSNMRIQQADDMHSDNQAKAITEIAFRMDNRIHTNVTAMGRTWTNITLEMSEPTNFDTMGSNFAQNTGPSPTRVFDNAWTWATQNGAPVLKPDVWGGVQGRLRFPFARPWAYTGEHSILADYTFRGGTLANNGPWGPNQIAYFLLDSEVINPSAIQGGIERVPAVPPSCNDTAISFTNGAFTYGYAYAYSRTYLTPSLQGKLVVSHYSYYTAPGAPVIHALGTGGSTTGVNVGAGCNPLYVDFSKPVALRSFYTLAPDGYSGLANIVTDWQKDFADMNLWLQSAWSDSSSKTFKLTSATRVTLPPGLPGETPRYKTVYQPDITATTSTGFGPFRSGSVFPFTRYKLQ